MELGIYLYRSGKDGRIKEQFFTAGRDVMQNKIPHFEYQLTNPFHLDFGCIKLDGKVFHRIDDFDEFYKEFGYTSDMRKAGVIPDEFIWDEYIQNISVKFLACIQIRIIEYLIKHSDIFKNKYGDQCESWLAAHRQDALAGGRRCIACRMQHNGEN